MKKEKNDLYRHYDEQGQLLYVGISLSALNRLVQHRLFSGWYDEIASITIEKCASREDAAHREVEAIKSENPKYNIMHNAGCDFEMEGKHESTDGRNLIRKIVCYKPIYKIMDVAEVLYGSRTGNSSRKVKSLIENNQLSAVLAKEGGQENGSGGRKRKDYIVTGWQLISFIDSIESGEISFP